MNTYTEQAKAIRDRIKAECAGKYSVTHDANEIRISLMSAPWQAIKDDDPRFQGWNRGYAQLNQFYSTLEDYSRNSRQVIFNGEWIVLPDGYALNNGALVSRKAWVDIAKALDIAEEVGGFKYTSVSIGKWNKPFEVKS